MLNKSYTKLYFVICTSGVFVNTSCLEKQGYHLSDEYDFSKPNSDSWLTSPPSWRISAVSSRLNLNLRRQSQSQVLFSTSGAILNLRRQSQSQDSKSQEFQTKSFSRDMPLLSRQYKTAAACLEGQTLAWAENEIYTSRKGGLICQKISWLERNSDAVK